MTQAELNREVAQATGESVATIDKLGFVPLTDFPVECEPLTINWDELDLDRVALFGKGKVTVDFGLFSHNHTQFQDAS